MRDSERVERLVDTTIGIVDRLIEAEGQVSFYEAYFEMRKKRHMTVVNRWHGYGVDA